MTEAAVLSQRVEPPAFDIVRAAHAELQVADLDASVAFYEDMLGLIVTERTSDAVYLRGWEERLHHCIVLRATDSEPAAGHLAFRVRSEEDLDAAAAWFEQRGSQAVWLSDEHAQGRTLRVQSETGFPLEFFHTMDLVEPRLQHFHAQRGAPIMRIDHFNLHVPDVERDFVFWRELGFRCSEYIATDDAEERITAAWMLRKPGVHDVALTSGRGPRLHHLGMWVADMTSVLRACDQLAAGGYASSIERGPGRHGVSNAFFVYLRDPDGHRIELYSCDYFTGDPDHAPLRWSVKNPLCRSFYGTRAPDSWYEESSLVRSLDGALVETREAGIDERTEIMA
jgi:3,4-dihydroxyphenylacetate 2,3-dioxygenase